MKKLFALILCVLLLSFSSALAEEDSDTEMHKFEISQLHVTYQALRIETGMDTAISYIQELGGDSTELETLRSDFATLAEQVSGFSSRAGLREGNAQMREKVKEFRELTQSLVEENGGDMDTLHTRIADAIAANTDIDAAREAFKDAAEGFLLDRFDRHYERLSAIYDRVFARYGVSNPDEVTALQSTLDSIAAYRTTLESAVASGDKDTIREAYSSIHELNREFIRAVQELAATDNGEERNPMAKTGERKTERGTALLSQMETTISELGTLGLDTSSLQTIYETAQSDYSTGQSSGDYSSFREDVKDFLHEVRELVGSDNKHTLGMRRAEEDFEDSEEEEESESEEEEESETEEEEESETEEEEESETEEESSGQGAPERENENRRGGRY